MWSATSRWVTVSSLPAKFGSLLQKISVLYANTQTIVDDFTKECLDIPVAIGISGEQVARTLDRIAAFRGYPEAVRTDQGPEFTGRAGLPERRRAEADTAGKAHEERLH